MQIPSKQSRGGPTEKHLPVSARIVIAACLQLLPSTGHGADHIENTSSVFRIVV
jgi:hypothetical protein